LGLWEAVKGTSADQGSYTMNATISGGTAVGNGETYNGSGTIAATLPAVAASGVTGDITLSATF
jgi:hypothetical protein